MIPETVLERAARDIVEGLRDVVREIVREEIAALQKPQREWLSLVEAAEYLCISQRTLERLVANGEVRSTNVERRRIIRREWLDEFAAAGEGVAPTTPPRRRRSTVRGANHSLRGQHHAR